MINNEKRQKQTEFEALLAASSVGTPRVPLLRAEAHRRQQEIELYHLLDLAEPSGEQLRRIAELAEALFDEETSALWWRRAADAGDRDAIDMVPLLDQTPAAKAVTDAEVQEAAELLRRIVDRQIADGWPCDQCGCAKKSHKDDHCVTCAILRVGHPYHPYKPEEGSHD